MQKTGILNSITNLYDTITFWMHVLISSDWRTASARETEVFAFDV
jgi:hypothetical protein